MQRGQGARIEEGVRQARQPKARGPHIALQQGAGRGLAQAATTEWFSATTTRRGPLATACTMASSSGLMVAQCSTAAPTLSAASSLRPPARAWS
jgi:hypothetical protein